MDQSSEIRLYASFTKHATVGTNTSTASAAVKSAKPKPGKVNVPKRLVIGTARGFNPKDSIVGPKSD